MVSTFTNLPKLRELRKLSANLPESCVSIITTNNGCVSSISCLKILLKPTLLTPRTCQQRIFILLSDFANLSSLSSTLSSIQPSKLCCIAMQFLNQWGMRGSRLTFYWSSSQSSLMKDWTFSFTSLCTLPSITKAKLGCNLKLIGTRENLSESINGIWR